MKKQVFLPGENRVSFWVPGIPMPGGSKKYLGQSARGKARLTDDCKGNAGWRSIVAFQALEAMRKAGLPQLQGPLYMRIDFYMPRPKAHFRTGQHKGQMKADAPMWHTVRPDTTKLIRALEDACTGIVWHDDALVCMQEVVKRYHTIFIGPGAQVLVDERIQVYV